MELSFSESAMLALNLFALLSFLSLILMLIVIPGFFIWVSLALIGKKRSLIKCGLANLVAFVASAFMSTLLSFLPLLTIFSPLLFVVFYLWVFKEILDLGFLHAIAAVIISVACVMALSAVFSFLFSAIFKPPWIPHFRF